VSGLSSQSRDVYCIDTNISDSDEDDTAELMAELAKIKQERAEEKAKLVSTVLA
jgi:hypothetical protein